MTSEDFDVGEKFVCQGEYSHSTLSGFESALWNILAVADDNNRTKLRLAYPDHVTAWLHCTRGTLRQRFE
jgi:hypothetical protein